MGIVPPHGLDGYKTYRNLATGGFAVPYIKWVEAGASRRPATGGFVVSCDEGVTAHRAPVPNERNETNEKHGFPDNPPQQHTKEQKYTVRDPPLTPICWVLHVRCGFSIVDQVSLEVRWMFDKCSLAFR